MMKFRYCPLCASGLVSSTIEGVPRACCPACDFVQWNNPTPVVAALVQIDEKVVLVHHHSWPEKMLGLVTGFLEANEDPREAVIREVKEELALDALNVHQIGNYAWPQMNQVILAYHVVAQGEITLNHELDRFKLIAPEQLKPWNFGTGLAIADWLAGSSRQ